MQTTPRPLPRWLLAAFGSAVAMLLLAGAALFSLYRNSAPTGYGPIPSFSLTNQDGQVITHSSLQGKVLLFSFVFTNCTDICPVITTQMREVQAKLAAGGMLGDVRLISVSVDPERDTPEALRAYAATYGADTASWHFLTGDPAEIRQVVTGGFLLGMEKSGGHGSHGAHDYEVTHSDRIILVDRQGTIRAYHSSREFDLDRLIQEIQALR